MSEGRYEAGDVAAELRRRLPGIGTKKLHRLLYYCQGHHLADVGRPLFQESIAAWEMGPVVGRLWKYEQENGAVLDGRTLGQVALNTVGYVISRYGALTGRDLEILTHGEAPWRAAKARGESTSNRSPKLARKDLIEFFRSSEDGGDVAGPALASHQVEELLGGASERLASPARVDDISRLKLRRAELESARAGRCAASGS